ncbi:hypothetical protein D3C80_1667190 [compost metagenome]
MRTSTLFRLVQQLFSQAHATAVGGNGDGIQARQGGAAMEQDQAVAHQLAADLCDDQAGMGPADHPLKAARRQPIRGKTLVFQFQQRLQVILCGFTK